MPRGTAGADPQRAGADLLDHEADGERRQRAGRARRKREDADAASETLRAEQGERQRAAGDGENAVARAIEDGNTGARIGPPTAIRQTPIGLVSVASRADTSG